MQINENNEDKLIRISEEICEASQQRGISYSFLHEIFAQNQKEISEFTGKKFIGVDSRVEVLLDWAYTQPEDFSMPIIEGYRTLQEKDHALIGLRAKQEALIEAMKYQTCKWKNEREGTRG